jgi:6-phosphogluconolactonase
MKLRRSLHSPAIRWPIRVKSGRGKLPARFISNRADHTMPHGDVQVFSGGENNIAVFQIDASTGEPRPVQHANAQSFHVRTFACDPSGRLLVTASIKALNTLMGDRVTLVPAALSVFRIQDDGQLDFVRKYDVHTPGSQYQYWIGMIGLP